MAFTEIKQILETFKKDFDSQAAQGVDAVIQYKISGDDGGDWNITVKDGTCLIREGVVDSAAVTLKMSKKTWLGLVNKTVNGPMAFMTGRLGIKGDIALSKRIEKIFPV